MEYCLYLEFWGFYGRIKTSLEGVKKKNETKAIDKLLYVKYQSGRNIRNTILRQYIGFTNNEDSTGKFKLSQSRLTNKSIYEPGNLVDVD